MQVSNQQWKRVHCLRQDKLTNYFNPLIFQQWWLSAIFHGVFFHLNDFVGKNLGFDISLNRLEDASYFPKSILKGKGRGKVTDYKKVILCSYMYYWFSSILQRLTLKGDNASANKPNSTTATSTISQRTATLSLTVLSLQRKFIFFSWLLSSRCSGNLGPKTIL